MDDDLRFKHPITCIINGPTGSGKSSFCIRFFQNLKSLCTEQNFVGGIILCHNGRTAVPAKELSEIRDNIRLKKGVPEDFENKNSNPCLIILDDLLHVVHSQEVCNLFTKGSHRRNISVTLITQILFHKGRYCRDISLNTKYLEFLKNVRNKNQF
jgi:ABC-type phosphate transport system ATPase subunit